MYVVNTFATGMLPSATLRRRFWGWADCAQLDRAVLYGLLGKALMMGAGPVTALLVAIKLSPFLQGFYFTFATLLAVQVFVELGLGTVLVQFASHEWARLHLTADGAVAGHPAALSRLQSIARLGACWYGIGGVLVAVALAFGGTLFFQYSGHDLSGSWFLPWLALAGVTGLTFSLVPAWALLEGCNQVREVSFFRMWQGVINAVTLWVTLLVGMDLWAPAAASGAALTFALIRISRTHRRFFVSVLRPPPRHVVHWTKDILPMQWRIAVSWASGYFAFSLFTPVLFTYHGPVVAGQMGLTWSLVNVVSVIPGVWLTAYAPQFGILIARRNYATLDSLFCRVTRVVATVTALLGILVWVGVTTLRVFSTSIGDRLLAPLPTGLFLGAQMVLMLSLPFSAYLRAHKREPLVWPSVFAAVLIATLTVTLARRFGATGVAAGYFGVTLMCTAWVIAIWHSKRRAWHAPDPMTSPFAVSAGGRE